MKKQSNPKPTDHFSPRNIENFLRENFAGNQTMRYRLANLFAGVREQAYQNGREDGYRAAAAYKSKPATGGPITEDVIMKAGGIAEDIILNR